MSAAFERAAAAASPRAPRRLELDDALASRLAGPPRLVFLDVDGTLAPIAPTPQAARVPDATRAALARLVRQPGTTVVFVSGRGVGDVRQLVRVEGAWIVGNHGCEMSDPAGQLTVDERVAPFAAGMADAARRLTEVAAGVPGAMLEDKRWTLSMHYRLAAPDAHDTLRAAMDAEARARGFVVTEGKAVLELRPPVVIHKGTAILSLLERLGADARGRGVLFAGDDVTDEDAFRALRQSRPDAVTVQVGDPVGRGGTAAELLAPDTEALRALLEWMAGR